MGNPEIGFKLMLLPGDRTSSTCHVSLKTRVGTPGICTESWAGMVAACNPRTPKAEVRAPSGQVGQLN